MSLTTSGANGLLNDIVSKCYYIGLSTSAPNADGTGITEPSAAAGYARVRYDEDMASAANGQKTNDAIIYFPESTGSWGTITHFVLYAGSTPYIYGALTSSVSVPSGYVPLFRVGSLVLSIT